MSCQDDLFLLLYIRRGFPIEGMGIYDHSLASNTIGSVQPSYASQKAAR